jgi:signal transduction histidine kinase
MRSLAIIFYATILGFLLLISYAVEYWSSDYYTDEVSNRYLQYAKRLTPLIEQDLTLKPQQSSTLLSKWSKVISDEKNAVSLIKLPKIKNRDDEPYVASINITEQTDFINIIAPLSQQNYTDKALLFKFYDSYSETFLNYSDFSIMAIYAFMALLLTIIAWLVFRYINKISQVTAAIANGKFNLKMPNSRIAALKKLANDINTMASSIEEKTSENIILTSAIHHELRIPITRIRLALDMALKENVDDIAQELLTGMDGDLEELSELMEELLTISRLRLTGVAIKKESVSLQAVLNKINSAINSPIISFAKPINFTLKANRILLERALYNIISNAVKYADKAIFISSKYENNTFVLTIADDGPGIAMQERALVLKPFYRTDKSRHRNTGGFGLGLAIADMVIKDTQGIIEISESELGGTLISLHWSTN